MEIIFAEKRTDGYHWKIQTDDKNVVYRQWPPLPPLPKGATETDMERDAREAEYLDMQKRELQIVIDAVAAPPAAPVPIPGLSRGQVLTKLSNRIEEPK